MVRETLFYPSPGHTYPDEPHTGKGIAGGTWSLGHGWRPSAKNIRKGQIGL